MSHQMDDFLDMSEELKWKVPMCNKRILKQFGSFIKTAYAYRNATVYR